MLGGNFPPNSSEINTALLHGNHTDMANSYTGRQSICRQCLDRHGTLGEKLRKTRYVL